MTAGASLLLLLGSAHGAEVGDVAYLDSSIESDHQVLALRLVDVDLDGRRELVRALRGGDGRRELHVHRLEGGRYAPRAASVVEVKEDVLAWTFADVRAEPGRELVFLTRTGAWSYSLEIEGYRDNIRRLAEHELLFDVPDPSSLPYWPWVLAAPGRERLLLAGRGGYSVWGEGPVAGGSDAEVAFGLLADFGGAAAGSFHLPEAAPRARAGGAAPRTGGGNLSLSVASAPATPILWPDAVSRRYLRDDRSYPAPALFDVDADGHDDVLRLEGEALHVHRGGPHGMSRTPDRVEPLPDWLRAQEGEELSLRFLDLDGDGRPDPLAHFEREAEGFANGQHRLALALATHERLLAPEPAQVLRFEGAVLRFEVARVDQDAHPDLVVRKFTLPSLARAVTGLEFTLTHLLYRGTGGKRPFEERAVLKEDQRFDETSVHEVVANRHLLLDCSGDGIADLVEIDLNGRIAIRRLQRRSSFFGGDTWSLERTPWKRFPGSGFIGSLLVEDLDGDGIGDVISRGERRVGVWLSGRGGRR